MEIVYCDGCAFRIGADDLESGAVLRTDDKVLCPKCKPKDTPPSRVSSASVKEKLTALGSRIEIIIHHALFHPE